MLKNAILDAKNCENFTNIWQELDKRLTNSCQNLQDAQAAGGRAGHRAQSRVPGPEELRGLRTPWRAAVAGVGPCTITLSEARSRLD